MDLSFWRNKRVIVTGADGFMGSHLAEKLVEAGSEVIAFVRGTSVVGTSRCQLRNITHLERSLEKIVAVDIASPDTVALVVQCRPDIIFHLAAIAYVPYSFKHPMEVHHVNCTGTLNLLEGARQLPGLYRLVVTSSSEVYGGTLTDRISEEHPLNPTSPYAASKVAADRYAYSYFKTYDLPISIIRPFNYYGPRHTYDVIPKFIDMVLAGQAPTIYGTGEQSRDFTYVSDMVNAFLLMGSHPKAVGETVNFGTGKDFTVKYIAETIIKIFNSDLMPVYVEKRAAEVDRLCCDARKAFQLFGWQPAITIEKGLELNV